MKYKPSNKLLFLTAACTLISIAGCPGLPTDDKTYDLNAKLIPFESSDALLEYFRNQSRTRTQHRNGGLFGLGLGLQEDDLLAPTNAGEQGAGGANDEAADAEEYSTTNLQEAGVDESDVFKSDGQYFYIARNDNLKIVKAFPAAQMAQVADLDLDVHVSEMYLYGQKLILLAQRYSQADDSWNRPSYDIWPPYYVSSKLTLVTVDVSDPAAPTVLKTVDFDGTLVDSRLTNDRLILVLTVMPELPENPNVLSLSVMPLNDFMPKARIQNQERNMVEWGDCLRPDEPCGYSMTAVVTVDAADIESIVHSVAVVADAGAIYASPEALYVTDVEYSDDGLGRVTTDIHKFAFDEDGAARYVASGAVPGRLLNQFSLGEYEDVLRLAVHVEVPGFFGFFDDVAVSVASSNAQIAEPPSEFNAVYLLKQNAADLEVLSSLENIAPDEDIYAARFMGPRGFLVTFETIDPLFTLDLSDPNAPAVVGELKVPGYSEYLHPWGDDYLIGVGRSAVESEWGGTIIRAVQLSLFDVSDLAAPVEIDRLELGGYGSRSDVSSTHKAFAMLPDDGLLALSVVLTPVNTQTYVYDKPELNGVICFKIDPENGFEELGAVPAVVEENDYYGYGNWRRPAFIGNILYALTSDGVVAGDLADLTADKVKVEFAD